MLAGDEVLNNDSDGVGLLISILLRYPEVGSTKFYPDHQTLTFTFIVMDKSDSNFKEALTTALETYHQLEYKQMRICKVNSQYEKPFLVLTITRDVETLSQTELGLIVELVKKEFGQGVVFDPTELPEDEMEFQEEIITHMLATICRHELNKYVTAVREEGRVLVYSR